MTNKFLNRPIKVCHIFKKRGDFQSLYAAERWCSENGYECGSLDGLGQPIALKKGEYDLPQKWHNFNVAQKKSIDGYMISSNWREGEVKVVIFN